MTTRNEAAQEKLWRLLTDAVLESPGSVSAEEAQNIAEDILDTHSGKALLAAAKAEGGQCDGYAGDPGASAPRCESYLGHPGRHFIRFDASAAKAEGSREATGEIWQQFSAEASTLRDFSIWLANKWHSLLDDERESSLGRDAEGHLVLTLGPGAESPSRKEGWEKYDGLSPLEQRHADGDR